VCVASPSASQQALLSIHCLHLIARESLCSEAHCSFEHRALRDVSIVPSTRGR